MEILDPNWKKYAKQCSELQIASKLPSAAAVGDDVAYADLCKKAESIWRLTVISLSIAYNIDDSVLNTVFTAAMNRMENNKMSMNLYFKVKDTSIFITDFPWQTPTEITYAVMKATTIEEKLKILRDSLSDYEWEDEIVEQKLKAAEALLISDALELGII